MKEEDGVRIKLHKWHTAQYPDSFTGFDFVSWLVREFRDVSSRAQGTEWGVKLLSMGLFEHCRGHHGFLDGYEFSLNSPDVCDKFYPVIISIACKANMPYQ